MPRPDDDRDRPPRAAGPPVALVVGLVAVGLCGLAAAVVVAVTLFGLGGLGWPGRDDDSDPATVREAVVVPAPQPADALPPGQQELTVTNVQRSHSGGAVKLLVFYDLPAGDLAGDLFVAVKRAGGTVSRLPVRKGFRRTEMPGATFDRGSVEMAEGWGGDGFAGAFDVWVERGGDESAPGVRVSNAFSFR